MPRTDTWQDRTEAPRWTEVGTCRYTNEGDGSPITGQSPRCSVLARGPGRVSAFARGYSGWRLGRAAAPPGSHRTRSSRGASSRSSNAPGRVHRLAALSTGGCRGPGARGAAPHCLSCLSLWSLVGQTQQDPVQANPDCRSRPGARRRRERSGVPSGRCAAFNSDDSCPGQPRHRQADHDRQVSEMDR